MYVGVRIHDCNYKMCDYVCRIVTSCEVVVEFGEPGHSLKWLLYLDDQSCRMMNSKNQMQGRADQLRKCQHNMVAS